MTIPALAAITLMASLLMAVTGLVFARRQALLVPARAGTRQRPLPPRR